MKSVLLSIIFLTYASIFSQTSISGAGGAGDQRQSLEPILSAAPGSKIISFSNKPNDLVGDIHLFEKWKNIGVLTIDGKHYKLNNINFNIKSNDFEIQVTADSLLVINMANVSQISINNRKFKNFSDANLGTNKNYEVVFDGDSLKILKGYGLDIKYGVIDPLMVKKSVDTYRKTTDYYVSMDNKIQKINLNKKTVQSFFKDKADKVNDFAIKNKLSYKDDNDIASMFTYYYTL